MKSNAPSERLNLARDLPTSAEDVAALRRAETIQPLDLESYIRFLRRLPQPPDDARRAQRVPRADRPFSID